MEFLYKNREGQSSGHTVMRPLLFLALLWGGAAATGECSTGVTADDVLVSTLAVGPDAVQVGLFHGKLLALRRRGLDADSPPSSFSAAG